MTFAPSSRAAAALLIVAAQIARASFVCACAPCPLDLPAACRPEPDARCCGEETPPDTGASCACPHVEAVEALPVVDDGVAPALELAWESLPPQEPWAVVEPIAVSVPGPAPPVMFLPVYLRDLSLRL